MTSLKEAAQAYEPKQTKNIADLEAVPTHVAIHQSDEKTGSDGKTFSYKYITIDGEDYRVPNTVLEQLQEILKVNPNVASFKVTKKGSGLNTQYTVVQLGTVQTLQPNSSMREV